MIKRFFFGALLLLAIERLCYFQTGGFILSKMLLDTSYPSTLSTVSDPFFSEPLTFIGAGKQFYAFETADHQYVVKFMKFSRRRPLPWLEKLPLPFFLHDWKTNYLAQRAKRLAHLETSSRLALNLLSEEAGLIPYIPVAKTATLIDKLGISHRIDLSQTQFLIQKKAVSFTDYLQQNPSEAHPLITSYLQTLASQCHKGICNLDPVLERNYGVAEHRMILMDIGSLLAHPKMHSSTGIRREIFIESLPLRDWLQRHHPKYLPYFDAELKKQTAP
ncbi:MAG: hypothetical protein JSS10_07820 [Verrucomicrobia bacterium]|nr:hypothetical protein [Verrucomicrobiota bacterium]